MITLRALLLIGLVIRWCIAFHPHSGFGVKPMHGDFEAQRHWVEITSHLPREDWYRNTTDNDLQYWGIDYPPWSAYHSWLISSVTNSFLNILSAISPAWWFDENAATTSTQQMTDVIMNQSFGLHISRGAEDATTLLIMRAASLITDAIAWMPPAYLLARDSSALQNDSDWCSLFFLFVPLPQLLIDHGHFQFNSVAAGIVLWVLWLFPKALSARSSSSSAFIVTVIVDCLCAFLSATAVMFKQMSLYYAPAMAVVLLARTTMTMSRSNGNKIDIRLAFVRMALCFIAGVAGFVLPVLPLRPADVLTRMFPFGRGLYEDKVANVWCAISPVLKLPSLITKPEWVIRTCALSTIASFIPAAIVFLRACWKSTSSMTTTTTTFLSTKTCATLLTVSALSFFLFSFQVHEKSILMAAVSTIVIWICQDSRQVQSATQRLACAHFMLVSLVSLHPLAVKDKLDGAVWSTLTLAAGAVSAHHLFIAPAWTAAAPYSPTTKLMHVVSWMSIVTATIVFPLFVEPSPALPDIIPMVNSIVCCAHFIVYHIFWTLQLAEHPF